jgi:transglutaminase-like putative cysteine protease
MAVDPAPPRRYWRADTWDVYTGLGWTNSPLQSEPLAPNQSLAAEAARWPSLLQQFQRVAPNDKRVYAVNSPIRVDQPVQTWWRADGDLAYVTADEALYTVISHVPEPTAAELRARSPVTGTVAPQWAERYLALPDAVPPRVLDLAQEVVGEATTRYDQARAIERYLRTYPYNLDIPEPPSDRDLVDYFLYELQEGYCDYYASAMVVMARSVGVPARLASGYVQGAYDFENSRWVVTEQEGHSWVEVYFDGIGWVEFEPTGGRPELARPDSEDQATAAVPPLPPRQGRWWQKIPWGLVPMGVVVVALLALVAWLWRPRRVLPAAQVVRDRQGRLVRWGRRLGHPPLDSQTIREYSQTLGGALEARGQSARLSQAQRAGAQAPTEIDRIGQAFEQVQYSAKPVSEREAWGIHQVWVRLRRHLWWLWFAPKGGRAESDVAQSEEHHEP